MELQSLQECYVQAQKLVALDQGWQYLPCSEPEVASFGCLAWRQVDEATGLPCAEASASKPGLKEETIRFEWLPYGKKLLPEVIEASSAKEFLDLYVELKKIKSQIFSCNDPIQLKIGFVCYGPNAVSSGTSKIIRIPMIRANDEIMSIVRQTKFDESVLEALVWPTITIDKTKLTPNH